MSGEKLMRFKPHVTVASVVQAEGSFLMVRQQIHNKWTLNQPAGHLEADEDLLQAAQRELWEETGLDNHPQSLLKIFQWQSPDHIDFIRFTFVIDLPKITTAKPQMSDIHDCIWMPYDALLQVDNLRSPLVRESLICYNEQERYPLSILKCFGNIK